MRFTNREEAGKRLAEKLEHLKRSDVVVLGLARGGVPVAFEVAHALRAPLEIIVVRKIGVPFQPELAMGAIGEDGVRVVNNDIVRSIGISEAEFAEIERQERSELERRARRFRGDRPRVSLVGRTATIIDDGIATGSTASAACRVARVNGASRVVLAVPIASSSSLADLSSITDEIVCLETPTPFFAVGQQYKNFSQTSDKEVVDLLRWAGEGTNSTTVAAGTESCPGAKR